MVPAKRILQTACSVLLVAANVPATWSIVVVDTRTREVAIGSATCVASLDLRLWSPVVRVGRGAAAAQASLDALGRNRGLIHAELIKGTAPATILQLLARFDTAHQLRQYGIVDVRGRAAGFTGNQTSGWAGHVTGKVGSLVYAIQGNILVGANVVKKAEAALRTTQGDLADKLMAAMEAARAQGGDRRCTSAGKSAHVGYMIVARQGDVDGRCTLCTGCASGRYYMNFNVTSGSNAADPVFQLRKLFDQWRKSLVGRPDHHLSHVILFPPSLPHDNATSTTALVVLRDRRGVRLGGTTAKVTVTLDAASTTQVKVGKVTAKGNGTYSFPVRAGARPGLALLRIVVDDGKGPVLLSPRSPLAVVADPLWNSAPVLSAAAGGLARFHLQPGPRFARRIYLVLASGSGSKPGIRAGSIVIPVNPDPVFGLFLQLVNSPVFPLTLGSLDASGRANAGFVAPPRVLQALRGRKLTFAFATIAPVDFASNPVQIEIVQ